MWDAHSHMRDPPSPHFVAHLQCPVRHVCTECAHRSCLHAALTLPSAPRLSHASVPASQHRRMSRGSNHCSSDHWSSAMRQGPVQPSPSKADCNLQLCCQRPLHGLLWPCWHDEDSSRQRIQGGGGDRRHGGVEPLRESACVDSEVHGHLVDGEALGGHACTQTASEAA